MDDIRGPLLAIWIALMGIMFMLAVIASSIKKIADRKDDSK